MNLPTIASLKIKPGQRVLVRLDVNEPVKNKKIVSTYRLQRSIPTLLNLRKKKAAIIIIGHLGRPDGRPDKNFSLQPIAKWFSSQLKTKILLLDPLKNRNDQRVIKNLKSGQVVMLENLRFYKGEEENDKSFAQSLANLADCYVNDAFGASHRQHASVSALPRLLPSAAGLLLVQEISALEKVINNPRRPLVALIGGAKVGTKLLLINSLLKVCDKVLVGGAMANTLLAASGKAVGASPIERALVPKVKKLINNDKLLLPVDVMSLCINNNCRMAVVGKTEKSDINNDIGPVTVKRFEHQLKSAKTVLWNGPMGWFEHPPFNRGTVEIARAMVRLKCFTVAGGGETVEVLQDLRLINKFSFVSTGGGAMLEFLSGVKLPGLVALGYYKN